MPRLLPALLAVAFLVPFHANAADLPGPLAAAIDDAVQHKEFRASFSLRAAAGEEALIMRYDAPSEAWTVTEGDLEALDGATRKIVEEMQKTLAEPGELTYHDMADGIAAATLTEDTGSELIYAVTLANEDGNMGEKMQAAVAPTLILDKATGTITRFAMRADEPFKPAAVAKIEKLVLEQDFTALDGGPAVITRYHNEVAGSAMFKNFDEQFTLEFFDFVPMK